MKSTAHETKTHGLRVGGGPSPRMPGARGILRRSLAATVAAILACGWAAVALPAQSIRFAVMSDTHVYDTRLGTTGEAFENYLATDPKLLALSEPIIDQALAEIAASGAQFLVITGDLTKDGEVRNHVRMAQKLQKLEQAGVQVFVIPGNHDINNQDAVAFDGAETRPVPSASPAVFRALYQRFGYGEALSVAPDSLSYVAEPVPGLRLLCLDSCKWAESANEEHPVVGGRISPATMTWALAAISDAQVQGKRVIGFMHHGVNLHFFGQSEIFADYLVDDWPLVGGQFAVAGLRAVFTGHYHAQDAAWMVDATGQPLPYLLDIETGSLTSFPCAYRCASLDQATGVLSVTSKRVTSINADLGMPFQDYVQAFARDLLPYQVIARLQLLFGISEQQAAAVAPWVVDALVANYAGDESPTPATLGLLAWLKSSGDPTLGTLGLLLGFMWVDRPPGDNVVTTVI